MDSLNPYNPFENRKKGSHYTREQLDYIKQLLENGWSVAKIAKTYDLNTSSIRRRIEQKNWTLSSQRTKKLSQKELDSIKKELEKKIPVEKIAKKYNISTATILKRKANDNWILQKRKNKYSFNESYFDTIDTEHKAYWLGFLMADGYILSKRKGERANQSQSFGFSISTKDIELLKNFKKDLNAENPINIYTSNSGFKENAPAGRILLTSQHTVDCLKSHGIVENKTFITKMPNINENLIPHFIRGYSDGDGSIVIDKNNRVQWAFCGTKELLSSFQEFFGTDYKLTQRFPERQNNNWTLKITGWTNIPRCLDICYSEATIFLKRKYDKYVEIQGNK